MSQHNSANLDALLAQSLAMQDYIDLQNDIQIPSSEIIDASINTNNTNNNSQNSKQNIHRIQTSKSTTSNTKSKNPKQPPKVLNKNCLPPILNTYVTSKSIINLSQDISSINPDIYNLFFKYNYLYFDNSLSGCEVKWSKRMTLCAGLCCYEGNGGLCSIKLSSPLLKYRSTKEMIETLIHEMIHAYLFVTCNDRDRQSHGERFKTLMNVINYASDLNISIYHTFHDEVDAYRKHIWKCNGPCQYKKPYFGLVKRSMNRVPGPNDNWWKEHQINCGGNYVKISEPKEFTEKQKKKKERAEKKKLKQEMKNKNMNGNVKKKKGRKRKRDDMDANKNNNRSLIDMFGGVNVKDKQPPKKKRKIKVKIIKDKSDNDSDLEILDNVTKVIMKNVEKENVTKVNEMKVKCPICMVMLPESVINLHLDDCLS